jgi:hypothetical protein
VRRSLENWHGELMPMSRSWVETEIAGIRGGDRAIARLALVLAKAPYQVDAGLVETVLRDNADQVRFIRILAWCSYSAARRFAQYIAEVAGARLDGIRDAA